MAGTTPNFNLITLNAGDDFSLNGYQFTDPDRVLLDRLLQAALTHNHTGAPAGSPGATASVAPVLTLNPLAGSLPAGVRLYYKIALVGPDGIPTLASPETTIDSPNPVAAPTAPTAQRGITGGTLRPGTYYYRLSVYRGANTLETASGDAVSVPLPAIDGSTQRIILTLPTLPLGGDGFNVYRRIPGGASYLYMASIAAANITTPWTDTGSSAGNCERFAPSANTTSSSNSVAVAYPGGVIPVGYTWRIFRTDTAGDWAHSRLVDVVEETSEGSGIIIPTFTDLGVGTLAGSPPSTTAAPIPVPAQISYPDLLNKPPPGITSATGLTNLERLTQAQYDALSPPNANTVYVIIG